MKLAKNQAGMAIIEALLLLIVVAIIGFVGYKVHSTKQAVNQSQQNTEKAAASDQSPLNSSSLPTVKNAQDLTNAQKEVDQVNPDEGNSDLNQLDQQMSAF